MNMSRIGIGLGLALLMTGWSAGAWAGSAHVNFVHPEHFTDIGQYVSAREAAANMTQISQHVEQLAAGRLAADQVLEVDVLDARLAGFLNPVAYNVTPYRLMIEGYGPSITLRYRLVQSGSVLDSGEETVSDLDYLHHFVTRYADTDHLRFEKRMLDDWFNRRFVEKQARTS